MKIALGFAVVVNAFAYFFSDKIALWSSGAKPVSREELPRLYEVMERLAGKGESAGAEAVHRSGSRAERIRHRPQSAATLPSR